MYKCTTCSKVYKTRTSLTRHSHNHTGGPQQQHACGTCGVVFARRDILNRHVNNGHCGGRHRIHTACEGCRQARVKCDGERPCGSCREGGRECAFPRRTGRVSWVPGKGDGISSLSMSSAEDGSASERVVAVPGVSNYGLGAELANGDVNANGHVPGDEHTGLDGIAPPGDVHNVPWPWLHERDFMNRAKVTRKTGSPLDQQHSPINGIKPKGNAQPTTEEPDEDENGPITPLVNVIENLVAYAASTAFSPENRSTRRRYWESVSLQLAEIFRTSGDDSVRDPHRTLYEIVEMYFQRFNVLWPLLNHEQLDPDTHHPVLFLTVTSIGAMYGQRIQRQYGKLLHKRLRRLLSASLYDLEGPEDELVWLAQARELKQIASLYFGQNQGFSYAQHLAAITIAQLRRMDFFREPIPNDHLHSLTPDQARTEWQRAEARRRMTFGIFRTDVYTSVLLSTRPLVTPEEIKLTFPRSDSLWLNTESLSPEGRLTQQRQEDSEMLQMPFSDIVRIFLDRNEPKPELGPVGYELVLFGLQETVWRFSHDAELFPRLTGACLGDMMSTDPSLPTNNSPSDPNDPTCHRRMPDLLNDHTRLILALEFWSKAVNIAMQKGLYTPAYRDTLMSSLILYRLSMLRLAAPLEDLHHISYRAHHPQTVSRTILAKTEAWIQSRFAPDAAQQAWDVKTMIEQELAREEGERARFNFLAICSLHHAAVVLWTVAAMRDSLPSPASPVPSNEEIETFLRECPKLFSHLSPLGGNSFEASAYRLQSCRFPRG